MTGICRSIHSAAPWQSVTICRSWTTCRRKSMISAVSYTHLDVYKRQDGSTGITISVHTSLCCSCIDGFGTKEQKEKFLRPLIDGSKTGCYGLTEPNAGSDAAGQQTQAVYDEATDEYIINGGKIFTTNSGFADLCVVFALTDKSLGTKGISAFVVPLKNEDGSRAEGVTVSDNIDVYKRQGPERASRSKQNDGTA